MKFVCKYRKPIHIRLTEELTKLQEDGEIVEQILLTHKEYKELKTYLIENRSENIQGDKIIFRTGYGDIEIFEESKCSL